jgi:hypothetical protein
VVPDVRGSILVHRDFEPASKAGTAVVNKPRNKGTSAESAVVTYLRDNGFPHAERRSLTGSTDKGDISGCLGLCIEVKYANSGLKLGPWLTETRVERINAQADYGILVVKPLGLGDRNTAHWYAVMVGDEFNQLSAKAVANSLTILQIVQGEPATFNSATLRSQLTTGVQPGQLAGYQLLALTLRPPGHKENPDAWYRVLTLNHMVRLLRAAGYGER